MTDNKDTWEFACNSDDLEEEDVVGVVLNRVPIAVYRLESGVYATQNRCTHQKALLSRGFVCDELIECPVHQGRFHIPSGRAMGAPVTESLQTFEAKEEDGKVFVQMPIT